ncbi:hypothetical protein LTS18_005179 [Coniosporium uncinatum]|uniref:Uncharacterized protein n=1 Tax=Coniosporium uncinatum TaxID=93489 RepID=A0ACC3D595_9PEZI|nr:hypothetical protein LTS18_005179 [Coniosporium uncinatum]
MGELEKNASHAVRIVAPMSDSEGLGTVQLRGLWLDEGGRLECVEGIRQELAEDDEEQDEEGSIGKEHESRLSRLWHTHMKQTNKYTSVSEIDEDQEESAASGPRRRLVEIITDIPGDKSSPSPSGTEALIAGVTSWIFILGEMFAADHTAISVDGMCLVQDRMGGAAYSLGIGDIYFRSGPSGSPYLEHTWTFQSSIPDVIILNLGTSDARSFSEHDKTYGTNPSEFASNFEDTYISLVRAIRTLAYPPTTSSASTISGFEDDDLPPSIPIFIMRPFDGGMEHATQSVVQRLRDEGDKAVFWLDTSGWLEPPSSSTEDFWLDDRPLSPKISSNNTAWQSRYRLTPRGNQKVAIYLHTHMCRYLSQEPDECSFLPHEVYEGGVYRPEMDELDQVLARAREEKIREVFWGKDGASL